MAVASLLAVSAVPACTAAGEADDVADGEDQVKVDTSSRASRAQYDANVAFALGYVPRCPSAPSTRPRVLVTGFGRFGGITDNATGRVVSTVVPEAAYPETQPAPAGQVDPPEAQLSVGARVTTLPGFDGEVEICGMVLPVYWDLAAILIAKEIDAFGPSFVMMNGVAGFRQDLWLELGASNRAAALNDGSNQLHPVAGEHGQLTLLVPDAAPEDYGRGNLLSWRAVQSAAAAAVAANASRLDGDVPFSEDMPGVALAGFPRTSNTYLCNNVTYTTGYLMDHPGTDVRLLEASTNGDPGAPSSVTVRLERDHARVPRVFAHWPSALATRHREAGAEVMKAVLGAQLAALAAGDLPTRGTNENAHASLRGGATF